MTPYQQFQQIHERERQTRVEQLQHSGRHHEQSLSPTHLTPDARLDRIAHKAFNNSGALLPFSHFQQRQQYQHQHQQQKHYGYQLQNDCSPLPHNLTPPPSSESLVALLREQRSPMMQPGTTLFSGLPARGGQQVSDDDDENSYNDSVGTASPMQTLIQDYSMEDAASSHTSSPAQLTLHTRQQIARAAKASVAFSDKGTKTTVATANGATGGAASSGEKRSRYLREMDRRSIIHRIDRGEKQAALAKEFGVTRAAICHINKNRVEILTRSTRAGVHSNARHPKRGLYTTSMSSVSSGDGLVPPTPLPAEAKSSVFEVRSLAMALLMATLRRRDTEHRDFQNCADRVFRLLLEEALARVPTCSIELTTPSDYVCEGLSVTKPSCGVSISEDGFPLLQVFRSIQPTSPSGFITLNATAIHEGISIEPTLQKVCVPPDLRAYDVFLLEATCATGAGACVAIQALLDFGAQEASIHLVCLLVSALAVSEICSRFPAVRIVTGAVDQEVREGGGEAMICPGLGNFTERYVSGTVVHHTRLGANVGL